MSSHRPPIRAHCLFAALLLAALAAPLAAQGDLDAWLQKIASPDAGVRQAAWLGAARYGPAAIGPLGRLMAGEDPAVARAARLAMEVIVHDAAAPGAEEKRGAASRALCEALRTQQPATTRALELRMLGLVGGGEAVPLVSGLLGDKDIGEDARQALVRIPGRAAGEALLSALDRGAPEAKPALINALAQHGADGAGAKLIALAADANADVRVAALAGLGRLGDLRAREVLLKALSSAGAAEREAAGDSLLALAERRLEAGDKTRSRRLYERVLRADLATGRRVAALTGLKRLGDPASLGTVLRSLGDPNPVFQQTAMALVDQFAGKDAVRVMIHAARTAPPAARAGLLLGLASRDDPAVAPTLRAALGDPSDSVKAAAAAGVGRMSDQAAAPELLKLAETGQDPARQAALNSYLRLLAAQLAKEKTPDLSARYSHALEIAGADPERNLALVGVAGFGDPASLTLVEPLTLSVPTRDAALRAYVAIGKTLLAQNRRDEAKAVFQNAVSRSAPRDVAAEAAAQLRALGVEIDLARESGFITQWWLVGTFPNRDQAGFDAVYPPETEADPARPVTYDGKDLAWKPVRTDDVQGIVDLIPALDPHDNVCAYAHAVVRVPTDQAITMKIGSDDAVKVWVNGRQVHANNAYRPLTVDEDKARARLQAGDNAILVKIVQGGGNWSFCLRLLGADGAPVKWEQVSPK